MGLILRDVSFAYAGAARDALTGVNLALETGRFYGVLGATGAGKSTLCNLLTGLAPHFLKGTLRGEVILDGTPTTALKIDDLVTRVGYVFQNPFEQLSHVTYTVEAEVAFGLQNLGIPADEIRSRVEWALRLLHIESLRDRYPLNLSGGQLQRLAVASILAMRPSVIVLDEPTSQLDPQGTREVFDAVTEMRSAGLTVVLVEHKVELLASHVDELVVLADGRIVSHGPPSGVFADGDFDQWNVERPQLATLALRLGGPSFHQRLPLQVEEFIDSFGLRSRL